MRTGVRFGIDKKAGIHNNRNHGDSKKESLSGGHRNPELIVIKKQNNYKSQCQEPERSQNSTEPELGGEENDSSVNHRNAGHNEKLRSGQRRQCLQIFRQNKTDKNRINVTPTIIYPTESAENISKNRKQTEGRKYKEKRTKLFLTFSGK